MFATRIFPPLALWAALSLGGVAHAQNATSQNAKNAQSGHEINANKQGGNHFDYTAPGGGVPKDLASRVGIEQNLNTHLPLQLEFKDENGKTVKLGDYFGKKPVMLSMLQLTCDQICSAQFGVMAQSMNNEKFGFVPGKEFEMLTVSIDPREGSPIAAGAKEEQLKNFKNKEFGNGWHFLTGDEKNIKALAKSLGIKYIWDEGSKQYIHPDGLVLATPEGQISRYFMQFQYGPQDMRFSIIEASKEKIGNFIDQIALSCFHYNPVTGRYSFQIMAFLRFFGAAFVLGSLLAIVMMVRAEKKRNLSGPPSSSSSGGAQLKKA